MKEFSMTRKIVSYLILAAGIASIIVALALDITEVDTVLRGPLLITGILVTVAGLYFFPSLKAHRTMIYIIFLFPLLFCFIITVIIPLILGIGYSFTDWDGIRVKNFVGFGNYARMMQRPEFIWSIVVTALFVLFNVILVNLVGFLLALLCTTKIKALGFFRAAYFLPNLIGGIVLGYVWKFIFNQVLTKLLNSTTLLNASSTALMAIVIVYIWQYGGYIMLIYITGLTGVPQDTIEAAAIDGANAWQTLTKIKVPMIAPTVTICTFLTLTSAFKQFDVNLALTNGTGSIQNFMGSYLTNGTEMLALNIYNTAISENNYALSQAKAVLFFILLAVISILQVNASNKKEVEL